MSARIADGFDIDVKRLLKARSTTDKDEQKAIIAEVMSKVAELALFMHDTNKEMRERLTEEDNERYALLVAMCLSTLQACIHDDLGMALGKMLKKDLDNHIEFKNMGPQEIVNKFATEIAATIFILGWDARGKYDTAELTALFGGNQPKGKAM